MLRTIQILLCFTCLTVFAADQSKMVGMKLQVITEVKAVKPSSTFTVAIEIKHFDGFHTYWLNPGLVGMPTQVDWVLPEGFKAGPIQWQVPDRGKMLVYDTHGYTGDTYLMVDIQTPEKLPENNFDISAKVGWMSCSAKTCCFLGFKDFKLTINSSDKIVYDDKNKKIFDKARDRLPRKIKGWTASVKQDGDDILIAVKGPDKATIKKSDKIYFFPIENYLDTESKQTVTYISPNEIIIKAKRADYADKVLKNISGLLYSPETWGQSNRNYLLFESPVQQTK